MKQSKRKKKLMIGIVGSLFLLPILLICFFSFVSSDLDIGGTINTQYHKIGNSDEQIIETEYFKLRTPEDWIHIFGGHGVEGDPYGRFWTKDGMIFYEYGLFPPDYSKDDQIYGFKVSARQVNRFKINIAKNEMTETGIAILPKHEMDRVLTFYMDKSVTRNFDNLIRAIEYLEFKKRKRI